MYRTLTLALVACLSLPSFAATGVAASWQADVAVEMAAADPVYLVVDVVSFADGSVAYQVTDLLIGFENASTGVEPDEID